MNKLIVFVLILLTVACASSGPTAYMKSSDKGQPGYHHQKLTDNQYRVTFVGNRHTNQEQVKDYALLRAAELTLENDKQWFVITSTESDKQTRKVSDVDSSVSMHTTTTRRCGILGCTTTTTPTYSGLSVTTREVEDGFTATLIIAMGAGTPDDSSKSFDASELAKNLKAAL